MLHPEEPSAALVVAWSTFAGCDTVYGLAGKQLVQQVDCTWLSFASSSCWLQGFQTRGPAETAIAKHQVSAALWCLRSIIWSVLL